MGADKESREQKEKQRRRKERKAKKLRTNIFIYTEGKKTEPLYFERFIEELNLDPEKYHVDIVGLGYNTDRIITEARSKIDEGGAVDHIWCVFDRDSFTKQNVGRAFDLSKGHPYDAKIKIAFSNECFELWYILHFEYWCTGMPRKDYENKLTGHLGAKYKKNDPDIYSKLKDKLSIACNRAMELRKSHAYNNKANNNPWTDVDEMINWFQTLS